VTFCNGETDKQPPQVWRGLSFAPLPAGNGIGCDAKNGSQFSLREGQSTTGLVDVVGASHATNTLIAFGSSITVVWMNSPLPSMPSSSGISSAKVTAS